MAAGLMMGQQDYWRASKLGSLHGIGEVAL